MVEFAIILPLLVLLLFGVTEIGRALYQQNMLHRALTVGARFLTHKEGIIELNPGNTPPSCTGIDTYDADVIIAKNLILCGVEDCGGKNPILPNLTSDGIDVALQPNAVQYDATNGLYACVIRVTAHAEFAGLFENVVPFTNITTPELNAQTEVRYIGY